MVETTVVNARHLKSNWAKDPQYLYIGRPSYLGNPFVIGENGKRADVIEKYRDYLVKLQARDPEMFELYFENAVRGSTLVCWCKPAACHGDVILEWLNEDKHRVVPIGTKEKA